jgi:hypothetical protein
VEHEPDSAPETNGGDIKESPLEPAIAFLRAGLRADGTYEGVSEWDTSQHQWGLLEAWCAASGYLIPEAFSPEKEGGSEHDVRFDSASKRWIKFTKPDRAGYAVEVVSGAIQMFPATPLQYLKRWRVANRVFGDSVRLRGLQRIGNSRRIVISQPDVSGEAPTWEELRNAFGSLGMRELKTPTLLGGYSSVSFFRGRLGVFDLRPANCVKSGEFITPIDVIPQFFNRSDASVLQSLMVR